MDAPTPQSAGSRWFVLRVASNLEKKMRDKLERRIAAAGLEELVPSVLVPTETISEMKAGKKRVVQRKLYPGYIMVEMAVEEDGTIPEPVWFLIRETSGIGDFVGAHGRPAPMSPKEVEGLLGTMEESEEKPKIQIQFQKGNTPPVVRYQTVAQGFDEPLAVGEASQTVVMGNVVK